MGTQSSKSNKNGKDPRKEKKSKSNKNKVKTSNMTKSNSGSNSRKNSLQMGPNSVIVPQKKSKKAKAKDKAKDKARNKKSKADKDNGIITKKENTYSKLNEINSSHSVENNNNDNNGDDSDDDEIVVVSEASDSDDDVIETGNNEATNGDKDIVLLDSDSGDESEVIDPENISASDSSDSESKSDDEDEDMEDNSGSKETEKDTMGNDFIEFNFSDDDDELKEDEDPVHTINSDDSYDDENEYLSNDEGSYHSKSTKHKPGTVNDEFPWIRNSDHSKEREISDWLTHEIKDFVKYISPSVEEINARNNLIKNLRSHISSIWPDAELHCFGSFATDLYLPGSDIDCVVVSPRGRYDNKSSLYQLTSYIRNHGLGIEVTPIAKAKVPIIKFVDPKTRIHIDISFERKNGLTAAKLIIDWLNKTPGLRELVLVVKQFLSVRKLNEVHVGGLGGFSIICLCYSFLKLHPRLSTNNIDPLENLGCLLIEFFELYGYNFGYDDVAIAFTSQMEPIYINKNSNPELIGRNPFLLAIQDPHDSSNNISRGSFNLRDIKRAFGGAFELLVNRCYELNYATYKQRLGQSILGGIIKYKGKQRDFVDARGHVQNVAFHAASGANNQTNKKNNNSNKPIVKKTGTIMPPLPSEKAGLDPDEYYMSDSFYSEDDSEDDANKFIQSQKSDKNNGNKNSKKDKNQVSNSKKTSEILSLPDSGDDEYTPEPITGTIPAKEPDFSDSEDEKDENKITNTNPVAKKSAFAVNKTDKRLYWEQKNGQTF